MQQLATSPEIQQAFVGICWVSIGLEQEAHPQRHIQRWAHLLGLGTLPVRLAEAQEVLRTAIGSRRILFVLDDVWSQADVVPFQVGGPNCRYVLTTRQPGLAHLLCQHVIPVPPMTERDALALFLADIPKTTVQEDLSLLQTLLQRVGYLPAAVILQRAYLRQKASLPGPHRFHTAMAALAQQETSSVLYMEMPWQTSTLYTSLQQSEKRLTPIVRMAFRRLAGQFQDTSFTEQEAEAFLSHQQLSSALDSLLEHGLLLWEQDRYHFHPLLAEYARLAIFNDTSPNPWCLPYSSACNGNQASQPPL